MAALATRSGPTQDDTVIPLIDDRRLRSLAAEIQPVQRFVIEDNQLVQFQGDKHAPDAGHLFYIDITGVDPRNTSFTVNPVAAAPATDLVPIRRIQTYHTMTSIIGASMAEVLAQIPDNVIDDAVAYDVQDPGFSVKPTEEVNGKTYAVMRTTIYGKAS